MNRIIFLMMSLAIVGCSSTPTAPPASEWTRQSTRTYENGYIVYVGKGEDVSGERAQFKAESAALEDLANECSFVPKGARLEDRYEKTEDRLHEAFAKVGVEFELCEEAKKAIEPDQVKKLANETMTTQIKKYQDMLGDQTDAETVASLSNEAEAPASPAPGQSNFHFFMVRQQIALEKQTVILAPVTVYEPNSPASIRYVNSVTAASQRAAEFQATHPEIKATPQAWSGQRSHVRELIRQRAPRSTLSAPPAVRPAHPSHQNLKSSRRKRRWQGR